MIYFKLAWRNIWRNKLRTLLSVAAIALVAYIPSTTLRSFQEGTHKVMLNNMLSTNIGHLQILHKDYWRERDINMAFELDDIEATIASHKSIQNILPRIESFALASIDSTTKPVMVIGVDTMKEKTFSKLHERLDTGSYFSHGIIINKDFARKMQLEIGDTIAMLGYGYHAATAVDLFRIDGICNLIVPGVGLAILPFDKASDFFSTEEKATSYLVQLNHAEKDLAAADSAISKLVTTANIDVRSWKSLIPEFVEQIEFEDAINIIITIVLYIIVSFGLFGTVLMMTQERRKEFGIMMAIGMNKPKMLFVVFIETVLIGLTGIAGGFIICGPIVYLLGNNPIRLVGEMGEAYKKMGFEPLIMFSNEADIFTDQIPIILIITLLVSLYPFMKILFTNISKSIRD